MQGLGESHERSPESGALLDVGQRVDTSQAEVVDLPAGGALFHHCQTLHYTPPNATSRQRRALAIHLMPPGTRSGHRRNARCILRTAHAAHALVPQVSHTY